MGAASGKAVNEIASVRHGSSSAPFGPAARTSARTSAHSSRSSASAASFGGARAVRAVVGHLRPHRGRAAVERDVEAEPRAQRRLQARPRRLEPHEGAERVEQHRPDHGSDSGMQEARDQLERAVGVLIGLHQPVVEDQHAAAAHGREVFVAARRRRSTLERLLAGRSIR